MNHATSERITNALARANITFARNVPLRDHTTFRIGGPASLFVEARCTDDIVSVIRIAHECGAPVRCIGGGSNLLVSDDGVRGLIVANKIRHLTWDCTHARVGTGYEWDELVASSVDVAASGLTAMSGIPGSVGGAIYGNAGAYGESVSDRLVSVTVVDRYGAIKKLESEELGFGYRDSVLKRSGDIVVEAEFTLEHSDRKRLREQRDTILQVRAEKHPRHDEPTAGSYFKNIDDKAIRTRLVRELGLENTGHRIAAGLLLDRVGARGQCVGGAQVFEKHANIIVNRDHARAADVLELSAWMRDAVERTFRVHLEPEVMWLGERPQQ